MKALENTCHLSASAVVIHYEEALYQVYGPLPLTALFLSGTTNLAPTFDNKIHGT